MNGSDPSTSSGDGQVELCYNNQYGAVCANSWDKIDAGVVCRQLRFNATGMCTNFITQ